MPITHDFHSDKDDPPDTTLVRPSDWNADHNDGGIFAALTDLEARVAALEGTVVEPPVEPPGTPTAPTVYGSAQGDTRSNVHVGWTGNAKISYRFKATQSSTPSTLRVSQRGGIGYSTGTGGTIRVRIETDTGGEPSGTSLAELTYAPGNPSGNWEVWTERTFATASALTSGTVYHIVFQNVDADPVTNSSGMNCLYYWGTPTSPLQPCFSTDYATLRAVPTTWAVVSGHAPIFDLKYTNAAHDGMNYIGANPGSHYGIISGTTKMVRERFTVTGGNKTVLSAHVKVKRISGTGDLVIRLEESDNSLIESVSVASSLIPIGLYPNVDDQAHLGGNTWAHATFLSSHVLTSGNTYNLRLSCAAGTEYVASPVQKGDTKGMASVCFNDGYGYETVDSGSTWDYIYPYFDTAHVDLQFYFVTS